MPLRPLPTLAYHPLRALFLAAFWTVSAVAFASRLERFSALFCAVGAALLGLGLAAVAVMWAAPVAAQRLDRR